MKTVLLTIATFLCLTFSQQLCAQIGVAAGAGLSFGTEAETVGLMFRGDVDINDTWGGSLNIIPYIGSGTNYWEINFDGHYTFWESDPWKTYALAGLNVSSIGVLGVSISRVGLNIGGGARYAITENISLFGEIKYIISDFDQLVISVGGLYHFQL